jgi:CRISPR-associated protein Cas1
MDETLWPARNVAEYAYCPRLFYYMEVEGIHVPSDDTEEGNRIHRRVDAPSATKQEPDPDEPTTVRSLTLTSRTLGLTATLDLAEIEGQRAIPVEYRKGRPSRAVNVANSLRELDDDEKTSVADEMPAGVEPWPTDRVQVALQTILLEDAGYEVPHAVLYYAAEKRRLKVPVDDALRAEALKVLADAKQCATGPRPLPLVNDRRCPRCSLQPICLPDEVNLQRAEVDAASCRVSMPQDVASTLSARPPRRIVTPRDDGLHVVAQQNGTKIGVHGSSLIVSDKDGQKLKELPLAGLESLSLLGFVQISTQAIQLLSDRGVPVAFLTAAGRLTALVDPLDSTSAEVRRAQVRRLDEPGACLELSRALVVAKIENQRTLLLRNNSDLPKLASEALAQEVESARNAKSIEALRGHEGQAAAIYFEHFAGMLKTDASAEFDANGRQRRPPPDPVNAALSFAYSMLTHECTASLRTARLEPSIGAFHVSRPGRPALALDLMEPFRPLISDSIVITAFNRGELKVGHFLRTAAGCLFTDAGRKAFFAVYGRRMSDEVTHPTFGYKLSYRRMIILHAQMIAAWLQGEIPSLAFLTTR